MGRYFERIADHTVNVAERVAYMVTGALHPHSPVDDVLASDRS